MNFSKALHLLLPPILFKIRRKKSVDMQQISPLPKFERQSNRMVVIGNGPSLNKSIELYADQIKEADSIMVNFSPKTDLFEQIKPSVYMLIDPGYYSLSDKWRESLLELYEAIVTKTKWPMYVVMPRLAIGSPAAERFKENLNIKMLFYNDRDVKPNNMSQFEAWDKNLICPPGQTVLNAAVWLSIYLGYEETYLIGADSSFVADLHVDQETNVLYSIDSHFYSSKQVKLEDYDEKNHRRTFGTKLHEEYFTAGVALRDYWDMREYAEWKRVKVYNASEYSWVDAFERKKLS